MPPSTDDNYTPVINGHLGGGEEGQTISPICAALAERVNNFLESDAPTPLLKAVQRQTRTALGVIAECLEKYSLEEISLSYNGGKDCLVLLILLLVALSSKITDFPERLQTVYIVSAHPFDEVTDFVTASVSEYRLNLSRYALPMKEGFQKYLEDRKGVKAILVGTRRTDPHGEKLTHFDMTDGGWPRFMRVHPVIDWHYTEIWAFIRHMQIPYCSLYDHGYTSLGGTTDTHPNPALKEGGGSTEGDKAFRPAYELEGEDADKAERLGRDW